ncbi:hypothetical protein [Streptomyces sp. NPDC005799]|uniref:hypothetical protein n=1 Tax=Streptomyces sp. NPDC005799 TaxID=3154678 RepID=UPI0033D90B55
MSGFPGATTAQAASTATCWGTIVENNSSLTTKLKATYNLKDGIGSVGGNIQSVSKDTTFSVGCGATNPDSGVLWFYGRIKGTETKGWMSSDNQNYVQRHLELLLSRLLGGLRDGVVRPHRIPTPRQQHGGSVSKRQSSPSLVASKSLRSAYL